MQQSLLKVKITYCAPCGYQDRVLELTQEIIKERDIESFIASWTLIPGSGGVFDVELNDELVFSKKEVGRHAEPGEIRKLIAEKVDQLRTIQL